MNEQFKAEQILRLANILCEETNTDCVGHCNLSTVCYRCQNLAKNLIDRGIISPLYSVGDTVYYTSGSNIKEAKIEEVYMGNSSFSYLVATKFVDFVLTEDEIYMSKKEAESHINKN